nr:septum formation family protein [Nocardioides seonyuensis]
MLLVSGCTTSPPEEPDASSAPSSTSTSDETPTATPTPEQPRPRRGECHRLSLATAVAPTTQLPPTSCRRPHTAETFFVGRLDLEREGRTLAVDSPAAQRRPAETCPRRAASHLGITPVEMRLTMARAVWFTPTVADAEAGADWFRCDLVVVAAPDVLMRLPRRTAGSGDLPALAMCGTAEPGTKAFTRVACLRKHAWKAIASVDLPGPRFPEAGVVAGRMEPACRAAARERSDDPLEFRWVEERPTKKQWAAGQRYGICWVPA